MYKYHNLNPISQVGLDEFTKDYAPVSTPETADAILVRSAAMHEMEFATDLKAIASCWHPEISLAASTGCRRMKRMET